MHAADDFSRQEGASLTSKDDLNLIGGQVNPVSGMYGLYDDDRNNSDTLSLQSLGERPQYDDETVHNNPDHDPSDPASSTAIASSQAAIASISDMLERMPLFPSSNDEIEPTIEPPSRSDETSTEESEMPSATADAMELYENIQSNVYLGSATGKSIAEESMPCECKYDPNVDNPSVACGDDNFCINRMMFMECMLDDCPCGRSCRNRRFQLKEYARVDVIKTEKKGFGLRALTDLPNNAFIMEYIGEVIPNSEFIRRTKAYETEGLKHYYFMTLKTDEIIDATKKGCLARFINHSCSPNCVTQKWVVGKTMRIGIFTRSFVKAGTELTFDYKFERYGAVAQVCYCGEPNCKGYIGGATKEDSVERSVEPSDNEDNDSEKSDTSESDEEEAVTLTQKKMIRKIHRRRASEPLQDPDKVQSFVKKMLDSVGKKHLVNMLLRRLELTNANTTLGRSVLKKFVRMHGLRMLKFWLREWKSSPSIVKKILHVLGHLPLANRNGLEDCQMFDLIERFTKYGEEDVASSSQNLLDAWSELKSVYRIPKRAYVEPKVAQPDTSDDQRRESLDAEGSAKRRRYNSSSAFFEADDDYLDYVSLSDMSAQISSMTQHLTPDIPTAPRAMLGYDYGYEQYAGGDSEAPLTNDMPQAETPNVIHYQSDYPTEATAFENVTVPTTVPHMQMEPHLPHNWKTAVSDKGQVYYYNVLTRKTQWTIPQDNESSIDVFNASPADDLAGKASIDGRTTYSASPAPSFASRTGRSPRRTLSPRRSESSDVLAASRSKDAGGMDDVELKKEVGRVVTKYLSAKQKALWHGDKRLFKELARKITHHIVDRETKSARKLQKMNSAMRAKIEKLIDSHGQEFVKMITRKKRPASSESTALQDDTMATSSTGTRDSGVAGDSRIFGDSDDI